MMHKICITLFVILLFQFSSEAQYTVKGTLKDTTAGTFLEKAVVALEALADSTF